MHDDRLSRLSDREIFEAIVSQLEDPDLVRFRRIFLVLTAVLYAVGTIGIGVAAGLGWSGVLAFSSTFVPGIAVAQRLQRRRFARRGLGAP